MPTERQSKALSTEGTGAEYYKSCSEPRIPLPVAYGGSRTKLARPQVAIIRAQKCGMLSAELIHHTDSGGLYASARYRAVLRRAAMRQSMSRAGNVYDNAFMESCFGLRKGVRTLLRSRISARSWNY
jgi:transposase InsO family protein